MKKEKTQQQPVEGAGEVEKEQVSSSKERSEKPGTDAAVKAVEKDPKKEVKKSSEISTSKTKQQEEQTDQAEATSSDTVASLVSKKKGSLVPSIQVDKEKSPGPPATGDDASAAAASTNKRGSTGKVPLLKEPDPAAPGSRRGSFIEPAPGAGQRRGSFLINEPSKDAANEGLLGAGLKKAPSRRGSDARRGSVADDDPAEKPSIPLVPIPGPAPKIVDCQANQSATEGKTAVIQFNVQGDPPPTFQFFKDDTEIFEGGRYKMVTDGKQKNLIMFCIRKSKVNDEGKYKFVAKNEHGQDSAEVQLFVGGEEGMDFRAMLRKGKKVAKKKEEDPDFGSLKSVESERKASIKEMKVGFFLYSLRVQWLFHVISSHFTSSIPSSLCAPVYPLPLSISIYLLNPALSHMALHVILCPLIFVNFSFLLSVFHLLLLFPLISMSLTHIVSVNLCVHPSPQHARYPIRHFLSSHFLLPGSRFAQSSAPYPNFISMLSSTYFVSICLSLFCSVALYAPAVTINH